MTQKQVQKESQKKEKMIEIPKKEYNQLVTTLKRIKESKEQNDIMKKIEEQAEEVGETIKERGGEGGLLTKEEKAKVADEYLEEKGLK